MNIYPNSIYARSGPARTLGAAWFAGKARGTRAKNIFGITSAILRVMRRGLFVFARIFDGIAKQRDCQAKQIVAFYGQDRSPDSIEREIGTAHPGKEPEFKLGAWHWH
jgi:hypothetical protein